MCFSLHLTTLCVFCNDVSQASDLNSCFLQYESPRQWTHSRLKSSFLDSFMISCEPSRDSKACPRMHRLFCVMSLSWDNDTLRRSERVTVGNFCFDLRTNLAELLRHQQLAQVISQLGLKSDCTEPYPLMVFTVCIRVSVKHQGQLRAVESLRHWKE